MDGTGCGWGSLDRSLSFSVNAMNVLFETCFPRPHGAQARYRPRTGVRTSSAVSGLKTWDTASVHDDGGLGRRRGPEGAPEPVQAIICSTACCRLRGKRRFSLTPQAVCAKNTGNPSNTWKLKLDSPTPRDLSPRTIMAAGNGSWIGQSRDDPPSKGGGGSPCARAQLWPMKRRKGEHVFVLRHFLRPCFKG